MWNPFYIAILDENLNFDDDQDDEDFLSPKVTSSVRSTRSSRRVTAASNSSKVPASRTGELKMCHPFHRIAKL